MADDFDTKEYKYDTFFVIADGKPIGLKVDDIQSIEVIE